MFFFLKKHNLSNQKFDNQANVKIRIIIKKMSSGKGKVKFKVATKLNELSHSDLKATYPTSFDVFDQSCDIYDSKTVFSFDMLGSRNYKLKLKTFQS